MAYGDVFIQTQVPPIPQGAPQSQETYIALVKQRLNEHLRDTGLSPVQARWCGRTDVPRSPSSNEVYLNALLEDTKIDPGSVGYEPTPTDRNTVYCITSTSVILCYGTLVPEWKDPNSANPFAFKVDLGAGYSVEVAIEFVVRWMQPLEGNAPTE